MDWIMRKRKIQGQVKNRMLWLRAWRRFGLVPAMQMLRRREEALRLDRPNSHHGNWVPTQHAQHKIAVNRRKGIVRHVKENGVTKWAELNEIFGNPVKNDLYQLEAYGLIHRVKKGEYAYGPKVAAE